MKYKIGLLHTGIREDERMIIKRSEDMDNIEMEALDLRKNILNPGNRKTFEKYDLILQRCASANKAEQALWYLSEFKIPVLNSLHLSLCCKNKFTTNLRLAQNNIPTPKFGVAFTEEQAINLIEEIGGYPVVVKPVSNTSWGRLMGKINDQDALEMILEHKEALGVNHQSFYIQQYIEKKGRDIRAYLVGDKIVSAVYRDSKHWITNTARGGSIKNCSINKELDSLGKKVYQKFGKGLLALDLFETKDGYLINEINDTMEFKNVVKITNIDIPGEVLKFCVNYIESQ